VIPLLVRRLLAAVALLLLVSGLVFSLMSLRGDDIVQNMLGEAATPEQIELRAQQLGLHDPLPVRYANWLGSALTGDFGTSWVTGAPVTPQILQRIGVSLSLVIGAVLVTAFVSVAVGLTAAVRRGWVDRALQVAAVTISAIPGFWLALILVTIFAIQLRLFPATGYVAPEKDPTAWILGLVLPVTALAIGAAADTAQHVRGAAIDILDQEYIRTLRAHGISDASLIFRHVLRSAAVPALTILSLQFIGMLGGAIVIESIFALPGLGSVIVASATAGDLPPVLAAVTVIVIVVLIMNLMVDLAVGWLNPKARTA
jgi:peptide/nickel transport system permease protein